MTFTILIMRSHVHGISRHGHVDFGTDGTPFGFLICQRPDKETSYYEQENETPSDLQGDLNQNCRFRRAITLKLRILTI